MEPGIETSSFTPRLALTAGRLLASPLRRRADRRRDARCGSRAQILIDFQQRRPSPLGRSRGLVLAPRAGRRGGSRAVGPRVDAAAHARDAGPRRADAAQTAASEPGRRGPDAHPLGAAEGRAGQRAGHLRLRHSSRLPRPQKPKLRQICGVLGAAGVTCCASSATPTRRGHGATTRSSPSCARRRSSASSSTTAASRPTGCRRVGVGEQFPF